VGAIERFEVFVVVVFAVAVEVEVVVGVAGFVDSVEIGYHGKVVGCYYCGGMVVESLDS